MPDLFNEDDRVDVPLDTAESVQADADPVAPEAPVADPVEGDEAAPLTHRLVASDDASDDLRVAFPGSHEVEGADEDGFVSLPVEITAEQANNASGAAFVGVEEID